MADLIERDPERSQAAHLLRRTSLAVNAEQVDDLAGRSWDDSVAKVVDDARSTVLEEPPRSEDWSDIAGWWVKQMVRSESGLHERLTWFWHTLLTTNAEKVSTAELIRRQLVGLRANAAGDYRTLLQTYVTGGALLEYLDASWSLASNPNENLGRELMELFTIGRGNYNEDDVRAAARALAGWVVEEGRVDWRREHAFVAPLLYRGVQDEWDTAKIVDHLCDQPETASNISSRLWSHFIGTELDPAAAAELGAWWQSRDLAILDLVERILSESLAAAERLSRPRTGLEWFTAFHSVTGIGVDTDSFWRLEELGQLPYYPPNVGGWPEGRRWLSPGSVLGRISMAVDLDPAEIDGGRSGTTDDILNRCGLFEVTQETIDAIGGVRSSDDFPPDAAYRTKWRLALSSPEFNLS